MSVDPLTGQLVDSQGDPIPDELVERTRAMCADAASASVVNILTHGSQIAYATLAMPGDDAAVVGCVLVALSPSAARSLIAFVDDLGNHHQVEES